MSAQILCFQLLLSGIVALSSSNARTSLDPDPAPQNLRIVSVNATSVSLEWDEPEFPPGFNFTSYWVQVPGSERQDTRVRDSGPKISTTVTGFAPFQQFTIIVWTCGIDPLPICEHLRSLQGRTDAAAPSAPQHLILTVLSDVSAKAEWEVPEHPNGRIDGYYLRLIDSSETVRDFFDGSQTFYVFKNLDPRKSYRVELTAHNFDQKLKRLDSEAITTTFSTAPAASIWFVLGIVAAVILVSATLLGIFAWIRRDRRQQYGPIEDAPSTN